MSPAFLAWGIPARTSGLLDEQHNQSCGSEYSRKGPGPLSFVACGDERTPPRVRDFRFQHRCEDNLADAPRAYCNPQNGKWISADSVSRIALWKVWSVHWLRRSVVTYSLLDTSDAEALFCVSGFSDHVERFVFRCSLNFLENAVSEIGISVPSTNVFNIITVGHMKRI